MKTTTEILSKLKKLINKHRGCLAIGQIHEAEAAMFMINKLLLEYNLTLADVAGGGEMSEEEQNVDIIEGNKINIKVGDEFGFLTNLADVIAKYNFCKCLYSGIGTKLISLTLVGEKINVQTSQFLFSFLKNNFTYNADKAAKKHSLEPIRRNNYYRDFLRGTVNGIEYKFKKERTSESTAIILYNNKMIKKYLEKQKISEKNFSCGGGGRKIDVNAYWDGEEYGRNVNIHKGIENQTNSNSENLKIINN
jgi:hypothetical protein